MEHTLHCITIEPTKLSQRGQMYRGIYAGSILIESNRNPEFDACRALLAKGITGKIETWRPGVAFPAMQIDIERGAQLTVTESDKDGPCFAPWHPHPDAVPYAPCESRTGVLALVAT
jgi:hypothetical protein